MIWVKNNKYGNKPITIDGITFQSIKEGSRWQKLRLLERAGEITGLARQVRIELVPKTTLYRAVYYIADFVYFDKKSGKTVYEDTKGYRTQIYELKKKLLYWRHGIEVKET